MIRLQFFIPILGILCLVADVLWLPLTCYFSDYQEAIFIAAFLVNYRLGFKMLYLLIVGLAFKKYIVRSFTRVGIFSVLLCFFLVYGNIICSHEKLETICRATNLFFLRGLVFLVAFPLAALLLGWNPYRVENPVRRSTDFLSIFLQGRLDGLPINRPQEGILILGSPGSGKTRYAIEPILHALLKKGFCGILYDYDFSVRTDQKRSLSALAFNILQREKIRTNFFSINFDHLDRSHCINPVSPELVKDRYFLRQIIHTLLSNLMPQRGDAESFFFASSIALLEGIVLLLANQYPTYCTIPHALVLLKNSHAKLFEVLKRDKESYQTAHSIIESNDAPKQLRGILSTLEMALHPICQKEIFWLLSQNTIPFHLTDLKAPALVAIGNSPTRKKVCSPIIAGIITALYSGMCRHNGQPSFMLLDELPTIFLPDLSEVPATVRKYNIATVVAMQSVAQLNSVYGKKAAEIRESLKNRLLTACSDESATYASKLMGKAEREKISQTKTDSGHSSTSTHQHEKELFSELEIAALKPGEFFGQVVGSDKILFHTKLKAVDEIDPKYTPKNLLELPIIHQKVDIEKNYQQIVADVEHILSDSAQEETPEDVDLDFPE